MLRPECYAPPALVEFLLHPEASRCVAELGARATVPAVPLSLYLALFLLTCFLESPFYFLTLRSQQGSVANRLVAILICNLATHPAVCFVIPFLVSLVHGSYGLGNAVGEVFAPLVEAALLVRFWRVAVRPAVTYSVAANLFSWWFGVYLLPLIF